MCRLETLSEVLRGLEARGSDALHTNWVNQLIQFSALGEASGKE